MSAATTTETDQNDEEVREKSSSEWRYPSLYDNIIIQSMLHVSSLLASSVSNSYGRIFTCFNCLTRNDDDDVCLRKKNKNMEDGAWFDFDQSNVDHEFCYENPIAPQTTHRISTTTNERSAWSNMNDVGSIRISCKQIDSSELSSNIILNNNSLIKIQDAKKAIPLNDINLTINNVSNAEKLPDYRRYNRGRPHVPNRSTRPKRKCYSRTERSLSFADTIEIDNLSIKRNYFLTEGDDFNQKLRRSRQTDVCLRRPVKSPISDRKIYPSYDSDSRQPIPTGEIVTTKKIYSDDFNTFCWEDMESRISGANVWKESELDVIFGAYNSATTTQNNAFKNSDIKIHRKVHRRSASRYDDVFPPLLLSKKSPYLENSNTIRADFSSIFIEKNSIEENVCFEKIKDYIDFCIRSSSSLPPSRFDRVSKVSEFNCDSTCLKYYNCRGFSKRLIYDLVKQTCREYFLMYKNTIALSNEHIVNFAMSKVLKSLKVDLSCRNQRIDEGKNSHFSIDINFGREDDMMVENALREENKIDHLKWYDLEDQEKKFKMNICKEIFDKFIDDEVFILERLIEKKLRRTIS